MKKRLLICMFLSLAIPGILAGCGKDNVWHEKSGSGSILGRSRSTDIEKSGNRMEDMDWERIRISPDTEITELEEGLSVVCYEGEYGFDGFLDQGGADSDANVAKYLMEQMNA